MSSGTAGGASSGTPSGTGRRYGGRNPEERREERRSRLVAAALEVFGTVGYAAASVRQLCRAAGLTERYFYESFRDREELLATLYDVLIDEVQTATFTAADQAGPAPREQIEAGLATFVRTLTTDGRKARVIHIEVVGVSPALEERRHAVMHEFAEFIAAVVLRHNDAVDRRRLATVSIALVGGVTELLVDWSLGKETGGPDEIVDACTMLFLAAYQAMANAV